jgi:hypothetical protein
LDTLLTLLALVALDTLDTLRALNTLDALRASRPDRAGFALRSGVTNDPPGDGEVEHGIDRRTRVDHIGVRTRRASRGRPNINRSRRDRQVRVDGDRGRV